MLTTGRGTAIFEKRSIDPPGLETCRNALFAFYARKSPLSPLFSKRGTTIGTLSSSPLGKGGITVEILDARFSLRLIRPKSCGGFASMTVGRRGLFLAKVSSAALGHVKLPLLWL
jgi:hypothetical protein